MRYLKNVANLATFMWLRIKVTSKSCEIVVEWFLWPTKFK